MLETETELSDSSLLGVTCLQTRLKLVSHQ